MPKEEKAKCITSFKIPKSNKVNKLKILEMIINYIHRTASFSEEIKNSQDFKTKFENIVFDELITELEFPFFTLFINKYFKIKGQYKCKNEIQDLWAELKVLAHYIKKKLNEKSKEKPNKSENEIRTNIPNKSLSEYMHRKSKKNLLNNIYNRIKENEISSQKKELSCQFNRFCQKCINYNYIVDDLLKNGKIFNMKKEKKGNNAIKNDGYSNLIENEKFLNDGDNNNGLSIINITSAVFLNNEKFPRKKENNKFDN